MQSDVPPAAPNPGYDLTLHDPVFAHFAQWRGEVPAGFEVNWLGTLTKAGYTGGEPEYTEAHYGEPPLPILCDDEYTEWVALLTSVKEAADAGRTFRMVELGAGYGRWLCEGRTAIRQGGFDIPYELIGVEAEPQH